MSCKQLQYSQLLIQTDTRLYASTLMFCQTHIGFIMHKYNNMYLFQYST